MPAYQSAAERRAAFARELTERVQKRIAEMRKKPKPAPVVELVRTAPRAPEERVPRPVHQPASREHNDIRNGAALINWSDPEHIAYLHERPGGSDVEKGKRNAIDTLVERDRLRRTNLADFEKKCAQDEARIRQCRGDGPVISDARAAWWPPHEHISHPHP